MTMTGVEPGSSAPTSGEDADGSMPLDVEISLVNTSNRELVRTCLASLPGACEVLRWHVTVVDNASTDGSGDMIAAEFPLAHLIHNHRRRGFSANHNEVIGPVVRDGTARYVLILNEDTILDPGSVARLVHEGDRRPQAGALGPVIRGVDGRVQPSYHRFPSVTQQIVGSLAGSSGLHDFRRPGWLNGSCVLVRVDALRRIGLLDEGFFIFFEDTDLGYRLHQAGYESMVCGQATIVHVGHQTVASPAHGSAFERQMQRSRYLFLAKHRGAHAAHLCSAGVRAGIALRALKAAAAGWLRRDDSEMRLGRTLADLARYRPTTPLPHELD